MLYNFIKLFILELHLKYFTLQMETIVVREVRNAEIGTLIGVTDIQKEVHVVLETGVKHQAGEMNRLLQI